MISTKTMVKNEFTKASGLEYEDCDMDVENVNEPQVDNTTNGAKQENESANNAVGEEEEDDGVKEQMDDEDEDEGNDEENGGHLGKTASTSANNLFLTQIFVAQRQKQFREAKMLETSIANLKEKLEKQSQAKFPAIAATESGESLEVASDTATHVNRRRASATVRSDITKRRCSVEVGNDCSSDDGSDEATAQTAVERSLAAMSKSKCTTSSRNSFNDVDDDENDGESKNDAFLERIFGDSGTDNNDMKNFEFSDIVGTTETLSKPIISIPNDKTLSAAMRRKRQRRNPVWPYFVVKDGMATCKHCNYSTKSVFSTNLKVHLRTHHHDLFQEVIKAEEEQQEQVTLQNSLLAAACSTTSTATTTKTPYMHHVTTTALPAFGTPNNSCGSNSNSSIGNTVNSNTLANPGSNLSNAAVLLGILNQTSNFQNATVTTAITTAINTITTTITSRSSNSNTKVSGQHNIVQRSNPRNILEFSKTYPESQLPLDYLKPVPDLTRAIPDFLKVISETSAKSIGNQSLDTTEALLSADSSLVETLKTFSKPSQKSPISYNLPYSGGRTERNTSSAGSQTSMVLKRRRLRRHPVWRFFKDVGDGSKTVKCVNCPFSTSSPFSTNLKMHLKAHHKSDYRLILILESRQRLEEGISPLPDSFESSTDILKKSSDDDADLNCKADEEPELKKRRALSAGSIFEDESFSSMTNTERVKAMIEMAAANQASDLFPTMDNDTNRTADSAPDEASNLVDTSLLVRLGLAKSTTPQNKLSAQSLVAGSPGRNQPLNASLTTSLDTTKSVRTISKRLPTGEVVKVRQTRKCVENPVIHAIATTSASSPIAAATATINTTKPIVPSRDLTIAANPIEQFAGIKSARDIALAKFLAKANAFQLLEMPEFKQFVDALDPTYQIPQSGYLKRLLESSTGDYNLPPGEPSDAGIQEQEE